MPGPGTPVRRPRIFGGPLTVGGPRIGSRPRIFGGLRIGSRPRIGRRSLVAAVLALAASLGLANPGIGGSYTIQAKNYEFLAPGGGSTLTVTVGSQVTWVASGDPHSVTSGTPGMVDNRFPDRPASAGLLTSGSTFTTTFTTPGTYPYFCEIHPEQMSGVITVIAAATVPPTPRPTTVPPTPASTTVPAPRPTPTRTRSPTATTTPTVTAPVNTAVGTLPTASPTRSPAEAGSVSPPATPSSSAATAPAAQAGAGSSAEATATLGPVGAAADGGTTSDPTTLLIAVLGGATLLGLGALAYRQARRNS
ncbi:MAG: hypothetical protein HYX54_00935 [Chloroflexi bacterium]|nr:hypothetical protein [Chloroflexota bacterium]